MSYLVEVKFECRLKRNPDGFKDLEPLGKLKTGRAICPLEGRTEKMIVTHPAGNRAGPEAAKAFPDACPLCEKKPTGYDFTIY